MWLIMEMVVSIIGMRMTMKNDDTIIHSELRVVSSISTANSDHASLLSNKYHGCALVGHIVILNYCLYAATVMMKMKWLTYISYSLYIYTRKLSSLNREKEMWLWTIIEYGHLLVCFSQYILFLLRGIGYPHSSVRYSTKYRCRSHHITPTLQPKDHLNNNIMIVQTHKKSAIVLFIMINQYNKYEGYRMVFYDTKWKQFFNAKKNSFS